MIIKQLDLANPQQHHLLLQVLLMAQTFMVESDFME